MGLFDRFKNGAGKNTDVRRDGRREMREIVILLARGAGSFSACADTISRTGKAFNPNYEAVSTGLGAVFDCIEPLQDQVGSFMLGLGRRELNLVGLDDTEVQFVVTLWNELSELGKRLAEIATEPAYQALRDSAQSELRELAQVLRHFEAVASLSGKLHFAQLDESGATREQTLQQLREFVSPKLIDDWASLGPDLRHGMSGSSEIPRRSRLPRWLSRLLRRPATIEERAANVRKIHEETLADYIACCPVGSNASFKPEELDDASSSYFVTQATLPLPSLYVSRLEKARPEAISEDITRLTTALPLERFSHWLPSSELVAQTFAVDLVVTIPLIINLALRPTAEVKPLSASVVSDAAAFFAWFLIDAEYREAQSKGAPADTLRMLNAMILWMYRPGPRALAFIEQFKAFRAANLPLGPHLPTDTTRFLFGVDDLLEALVTGQSVPEMALLERTLTERAVLYPGLPRDLEIRMHTRVRGLIVASQHFHGGLAVFRRDLMAKA
jgi:hypothetical protein